MPTNNNPLIKSDPLALVPLLVFLVIFIGTGVSLTLQKADMAFYQLSATVAVLPAIIIAILQNQEKLPIKINLFIRGVGENNIITMVTIYLLAGAFASVASSIGGVDATVNFGLSFIPPHLVLPGLFIIAGFVATAMGTSMGTVAAIAPIALGIGQQTNISLELLMGVVVGGAMFGDNLSMISDTTIAATRTQGCELKDKFIFNLRIAVPAALITLGLLYFMSRGGVVEYNDYSMIKVLPYIVILIMAIVGINVFVVLLSGTIFSGLVGISFVENYGLLSFSSDIYKGFASMNEIMILSMLLGGLGELVKQNGGIAWILEKTAVEGNADSTKNSSKKGEWYIAFLAAFADISTANNTVAIVLTGGVAKEIAAKNNVDPRRSASILDIVSCVFQGILPYSAQVLLAGSIAQISPLALVQNNWYCLILGVVMIIAIALGLPKIKKKSTNTFNKDHA